MVCECGETVRGVRRSSWIESECPNCCQSVFVLPTNVYPSTRSVPSEVLGGSFSERLKAVIAELAPKRSKDVATPETVPEPFETVKAAAAAGTSAAASTSAAVSKRRLTLRLPRVDIKGMVVRTLTPFRLLMLSMVTVIGLTIYWMTWQQHVESAQQTWLRTSEQAEDFLSSSDMINLEATLRQAIDSGYTLGKADPDWRTRLNLLQETTAVNSMAAYDLLTAFHRSYDEQNRIVADAERQVAEAAASGTFVFDSYLRPSTRDDTIFLMEFPGTPGRHAVEVMLPIGQIENLIEHTGDERAIFAAKIKAVIAPQPKTHQSWLLLIDAESFVLMTSHRHCRFIGLTDQDDPVLPGILDRQKDFIESSSAWEHRTDNVRLPREFVTQKER